MGLFKRGYKASREEKQKQDRAREEATKKLWRFFLKDDGDEADLHFLTEEPVNFYEHSVKRGDRYDSVTCSGKNCPFCADGNKPTYKGAYLVIDRRDFEYTDKNGKKQTGRNQLRLFVFGMKVISQLDRISERYGLSNREVTIIRLGKGTQTNYTIERGDECKLTKKEIEQVLPEKLRESYDGTVDSLYDILEEQLTMNTPDYDEDEDEDDEEESEGRNRLVNLDEDDESEEDDDLPFDDPKPAKKRKSMFKKKTEDLRKPKAKGLFKKTE